MNEKIPLADFQDISDYIFRVSGIYLDYDKEYLVRQRLGMVLTNFGVDNFGSLASKMKTGLNLEQKEDMISLITTHETMFFRDPHIFEHVFQHVLPSIIDPVELHNDQFYCPQIKIASLGCSTGQEVYSVAMMFDEYFKINKLNPKQKYNIRIIGVDIDKKVISYARKGKYSAFEVTKGLTGFRIKKYFDYINGAYQIKKNISDLCTFQTININEELGRRTLSGSFDLILARNVLIYFHEDLKQKILRHVHSKLKTNGVLILGSSESLLGFSDLFLSADPSTKLLYFQKR